VDKNRFDTEPQLRPILGGGTNFICAIEAIAKQLDLTDEGCNPIVIFMTDGTLEHDIKTQKKEIKRQLRELYATFKDKKYAFLCIGLGDSVDNKFLEEMTKEANGDSLVHNFGSGKVALYH